LLEHEVPAREREEREMARSGRPSEAELRYEMEAVRSVNAEVKFDAEDLGVADGPLKSVWFGVARPVEPATQREGFVQMASAAYFQRFV